jgi:hypothetical protein
LVRDGHGWSDPARDSDNPDRRRARPGDGSADWRAALEVLSSAPTSLDLGRHGPLFCMPHPLFGIPTRFLERTANSIETPWFVLDQAKYDDLS